MVEVSKDGTVAYSSGYVFKTGTSFSAGKSALFTPAGTPTTPLESGSNSSEVAFWGENNDFPTLVRKDVEESTVLSPGLRKVADMWYGGGIVYGTIEGFDDNGEEIFTRTRLPEVEAFLNRSRRYGYEALLDIAYFGNAFPEMVFTKDRSKVWSLTEQDAEFCRFAKPDSKGVIASVFINANWATGGKADDKEFTTKVGVLDPYADTPETVRTRKDAKIIYPISIPSPGKTIYQLTSWNAIRRSGWLDVARAIPEFKKKVFENQLSIKYVVEIHQLYWVWKYGEWETKTPEERARIIREELEAFNKIMAGTEGAGKSVLTTTFPNPRNPQEHIAAFKVTAIDDKLKSGIYVEDSQEAASHTFTALGLPPTLMGVSPGKGMGAGSGSDARVAFNNFISTSKFVHDTVLEPLHFIRDYNGWPENLQFRFKNPLIMTLDKGKQTQQETA
jgi:hypothetical protein